MDKEKVESLIMKIYKQKIELPADFIETLQDLESCLQKRISQGSPSKNEVNNIIKTFIKQKETAKVNYLKRVEKIKYSNKHREEIIKKLIS